MTPAEQQLSSAVSRLAQAKRNADNLRVAVEVFNGDMTTAVRLESLLENAEKDFNEAFGVLGIVAEYWRQCVAPQALILNAAREVYFCRQNMSFGQDGAQGFEMLESAFSEMKQAEIEDES